MKTLTIKSAKSKEVIDITDKLNAELAKSKQESGLLHLHTLHTTAALTTADLDPGTDLDILDALQVILPKLKYRHPHDPEHAPDHILSLIIGTTVAIPFEKKKLILGTWQRIVFLEFSGPRPRKILLSFIAHE